MKSEKTKVFLTVVINEKKNSSQQEFDNTGKKSAEC